MSQPGHNRIDPTVAKRWFGEAMRVYDALEEQKMENMRVCKDIRSRLPSIFESAEAAGIPMKALKAQIKIELENRKIKECEARQAAAVPDDDEDQETFEQLQKALGDFGDSPLGAAALKAKQGDDDADVRPEFLKRQEEDRVTRENGARLSKGITGLPGADATEA